jgi:hypothetical protein
MLNGHEPTGLGEPLFVFSNHALISRIAADSSSYYDSLPRAQLIDARDSRSYSGPQPGAQNHMANAMHAGTWVETLLCCMANFYRMLPQLDPSLSSLCLKTQSVCQMGPSWNRNGKMSTDTIEERIRTCSIDHTLRQAARHLRPGHIVVIDYRAYPDYS